MNEAEDKDYPLKQFPKKTVVAGSKGRMGRMLIEKASTAGLNVAGIDRPYTEKNLISSCQNADLVILCVPAKSLANVAKQIVPYMKKNAILADITSVKESPMRQMQEIWPGSVVGTHPLFGPNFNKGDDLPVVLVPGKNAKKDSVAKTAYFFKSFGCRVFESSALKHDQAMARIQNMNFITNLAYFAVLAGQEDILPFLTPSFHRRKNSAQKMLTEDAEMFTGLFDANGHSHEAVRQFRKMLNIAASGDIELLCHKAKWWWQNDNS